MLRKLVALFLLASLFSCAKFMNLINQDSLKIMDLKKDKFSIVFSHNISGETHPCGCRHHPLGGLPQVAGKMHQIAQTDDLLYLDSGDTFFPSSVVPKGLEKSLTFGAKNLAKGLNQLGLNYHLPGDQDLAGGWEKYLEILGESDIRPLIGNLNPEGSQKELVHQKWFYLVKGPHKFFITGLVFTDVLGSEYQNDFVNVRKGLLTVLAEMKKEGYQASNPLHRLIVLSNGGIENETNLARAFKQIDWIIGSHSQSFTREPIVESNTRIVQVLSRNHHLGQIQFDLSSNKPKDTFFLFEMRDELKDLIKPNPFHAFIDSHKTQMRKIQDQEQSDDENMANNASVKFNTANSCIECHSEQGKFWQSTPHAIAHVTLINAKEEKNLTCVKCHSLGLGNVRGFKNSKDMIHFELPESHKGEAELAKTRAAYWSQVKNAFGGIESVRQLPAKEILAHSETWATIDEKMNVTHNFANVQCLNCHTKHPDHPFLTDEKKLVGNVRFQSLKSKCLSCHNSDQSPEWYKSKENSLPGKINDLILLDMMKKVACPKVK